MEKKFILNTTNYYRELYIDNEKKTNESERNILPKVGEENNNNINESRRVNIESTAIKIERNENMNSSSRLNHQEEEYKKEEEENKIKEEEENKRKEEDKKAENKF